MNVLLISDTPDYISALIPSKFYVRVRAMPVDLIECYDIEGVYKHGEWADVILLPGETSSWPLFWNEIANYVEGLSAFIVVFSTDSYKNIWPVGRDRITFDAIILSQYTAYKERVHELDIDCKHAFWSPCCIDVQDHDVDKDIDVLFWGNPGMPVYPFRNFIIRELTKYSYLENIQEGQLIQNTLRLNGRNDNYVRLPRHNSKYWGIELYKLLSRSRICCTGSAFFHVPVARYFENAACGCITITNDFDDREALGFQHRKNIWITDEEKFITDLTFLLRNDDLVCEMSMNARQLIGERHTPKTRALELFNFFQEVV